ncbi:hypothetical protein Ahu01nite_044760 [Winogradskya humida]|uniref:Uncharacterized protein n=1 Tax=Winogradskya humida TaxID=113566 RepID=A0ABQ3ZS43_9ACTN|nr:hypothetical protein Ahu01nite_044760 [Actinoplanes humidus]
MFGEDLRELVTFVCQPGVLFEAAFVEGHLHVGIESAAPICAVLDCGMAEVADVDRWQTPVLCEEFRGVPGIEDAGFRQDGQVSHSGSDQAVGVVAG